MRLQGKRILVTDDEPAIRTILQHWLEGEGAIVDQAENGAVAFRKATLAPPDLVVMDLKMPDINGHSAVLSLRMVIETNPILVYTGYAEKENVEQALENGADDWMRKPAGRDEFIDRVCSLLEAASSR